MSKKPTKGSASSHSSAKKLSRIFTNGLHIGPKGTRSQSDNTTQSLRPSTPTMDKRLTYAKLSNWTTDANRSELPSYESIQPPKPLPDWCLSQFPVCVKGFRPTNGARERYRLWMMEFADDPDEDGSLDTLSVQSLDERRRRPQQQTPRSKPPTVVSETQAQGRIHETSKIHLWSMLIEHHRLYCIVSRAPDALQSAHIIEQQCPYTTLVRIYIALGGWFCRHSRLNLLPLAADIHIKWDQHRLLFFVADDNILNDAEQYLNFLDAQQSDDDAYDWFSLLRKQHRNLCEGSRFIIKILSRKLHTTYIVQRPEDHTERLLYRELSVVDPKAIEISRGTYQTYAHPLFLLVRLMQTLDAHPNSRNLWQTWNDNDIRIVLPLDWPGAGDNIDLLIRNVKIIQRIYTRMGDKPIAWKKEKGVLSSFSFASDRGRGEGEDSYNAPEDSYDASGGPSEVVEGGLGGWGGGRGLGSGGNGGLSGGGGQHNRMTDAADYMQSWLREQEHPVKKQWSRLSTLVKFRLPSPFHFQSFSKENARPGLVTC